MSELTYTLKTKFQYAFKGDMRDADFVILNAPTVQSIGYVAKLKQGFMRAVASQKRDAGDSVGPIEDSSSGQDEITGPMIMSMLSMSDIDYAAYLQTAKAVFSDPGIAMLDGEEPLVKKGLMDKMSADDLEAMTGEYLQAFILTSALEMIQT